MGGASESVPSRPLTGSHPSFHAEQELEQDREPEGRQTHTEQRHNTGHLIGGTIRAHRGEDAERDTNSNRDQHRRNDEL